MKVVAHRGATACAPENTIAAFLAARALGADGVEFDVQATLDGRLVVMHDMTLDRTTNGHGMVSETTFADIAKLDAGRWFADQYAGEPVPRLEDVLAIHEIEFELELKGYGHGFLATVIDTVDRVAPKGRIEFTSSNLLLLARLKQIRPEFRIGLFTMRPMPNMTPSMFEHHIVGTAETSGADVVHVYSGAITRKISDRLHLQGFEVHANDADSDDLLCNAIAAGADRVTTTDVQSAVTRRTRSD